MSTGPHAPTRPRARRVRVASTASIGLRTERYRTVVAADMMCRTRPGRCRSRTGTVPKTTEPARRRSGGTDPGEHFGGVCVARGRVGRFEVEPQQRFGV